MSSTGEVNHELLEIAQRSLSQPSRILITGGTGFVGSHLARCLYEAGHAVTITGRSKFRVRGPGKFFATDIANAKEVAEIIRDHDIVFHTAAWTSPWGTLDRHRQVNLGGTRNVVEGCKAAGIKRLVHVSSTAIHFQFRDRVVNDNTPLPARYCCPYAQSKAEAEGVVEQAICDGLNAYIVRARAVFGPGDGALLPRLLRAAEEKKLRQIGDGRNLCDLTFIDNLVAGLLLAADPKRPTGSCTITNQEPVVLWDVLRRVLRETSPGCLPLGRIPYGLAMRVAQLSEVKHRMLGLRGEPPITQYGVGLLAKSQTFQSQAAEQDLGYRPVVGLQDGIERTVGWLNERVKDEEESNAAVDLEFFSTGYIEVDRKLVDRSGISGKTRFHASIALLKHPTQGAILFDLGYSPRFFQATRALPFRLYRWATPVITRPEWSAKAWLARKGIDAADVRLILLSHFHADHVGGLFDFPNANVVTTQKAWREAWQRHGVAALRRGILPALLPDSLPSRIHEVHDMVDPGFHGLYPTHDLFRDGSIRLVNLDGHAAGQMGAIVKEAGGKRTLLAADSCWTRFEFKQRLRPTLAYRVVADDMNAVLRTRQSLNLFAERHPKTRFVFSHCPELAAEEAFDEQLEMVRSKQE